MPIQVKQSGKILVNVEEVQVGEVFEWNNIQFLRIESLRSAVAESGISTSNVVGVCLTDGKLLNLPDNPGESVQVQLHLAVVLDVQN